MRKLEPEIVEELCKQAAARGRSIEAELRGILREAFRGGGKHVSLKGLLLEMPSVGSDADYARARQRPRRVRF